MTQFTEEDARKLEMLNIELERAYKALEKALQHALSPSSSVGAGTPAARFADLKGLSQMVRALGERTSDAIVVVENNLSATKNPEKPDTSGLMERVSKQLCTFFDDNLQFADTMLMNRWTRDRFLEQYRESSGDLPYFGSVSHRGRETRIFGVLVVLDETIPDGEVECKRLA
ncbi:MAG: hypothetical protein GVY29_07625 [Spirochaetes bacterium]|jgi:hypothetical protein|nr:hypothetical protein [Spirochaetota bacterium]